MNAAAKLFFRRACFSRGFFTVCVLALVSAIGAREGLAQTTEWIRQFGTTANEAVLGVASDAGAVYVVGEINSDAALPGQTSEGGIDAFVRKYDLSGNEVWTRQFGTAASDSALGVAVNSTGVYVVGMTTGTLPGQASTGGQDAFVRKYDASGNEVWTRQFGSSNSDTAVGAAADGSGIYVVGITFAALPGQTSAGQEDAFVRKYDSSGNVLWTRQFGSAGSEVDTAVAVDASGVYVGGTTDGALPGQTDGPFSDVYLRKYDTDGGELWTRQFSSAGPFPSDSAGGVAADSSGVYIGGSTLAALPGQTSSGGEDAFVRKYDGNGTELWTRQFGATNATSFSGASGIAVGGGGVYAGGDTTGELSGQTTSGNEDIYVRKFDTNGNTLWTRQLGSTKSDLVYGISAISTNVYVAGETVGTLAGQTNAGQTDAYIVQLSSPVVCSYSIAPASQTSPAEGGPGSIAVSAPDGCPWTAASNSAFLTVNSGATGNGTGTVNFTVAANATTSPRTGTLTVASKTFTVTQAAAGCAYTLTPDSQAFIADGGSGSLGVTTSGTCPWTATSNASFLTITAGSSGSGTGTVNFNVGANPTITPRTGTLTVAGQTFTVNQAGVSCSYLITPTSLSVAAAGGTGIVTVTAPQGCSWTAASNDSFLTITLGASGSGPGTVNFTAGANAATSPRTGTLTVAGQTFTVNQAGVGCTSSITPTSSSIAAAGGTGIITVNAAAGCPWSATSNAAFLTITAGSSGSGAGTVNFTVGANLATTARNGTLTVAGQTFTVTQDGSGPPPPNAPSVFEGGVVNNASFDKGPVPMAPGSIAAIFGTNLNDGSQLSSSGFGSDGKLLTTLGGASVKLSGVQAPLFYSFPSQLGVQIPFELSGQTSATVEVTVAGHTSVARTISLDSTGPGIFTLNQQGDKQGAILIANSDILVAPVGSISGRTSRPAHRGEIITIFCTGLGVVSPALATGAQAGASQTPTQATVMIDGQPATVLYSGTAPSFVGLFQVNATVPNGARLADDDKVTVSLGGKTSNEATISVGP